MEDNSLQIIHNKYNQEQNIDSNKKIKLKGQLLKRQLQHYDEYGERLMDQKVVRFIKKFKRALKAISK